MEREPRNFNQLPYGFKGKQKRRTDFKSPEQKREYDAKNLIQLARKRYGKELVTVREALDLATRHDDKDGVEGNNLQRLRRAIAFQIAINGPDSPEKNQARLIEAVSIENFNLALAAAKELDSELQLPEDVHSQILSEIKKLSPERIYEICSAMKEPTLIIVPSNSFQEKISYLDENPHDKKQSWVKLHESFGEVVNISKVRVCIVEGVPNPEHSEDFPFYVGDRRTYEKERLAGLHVELIGPHAYLILLHQTLIKAHQTENNSLIADNSKVDATATILNPEELIDSQNVACAIFRSDIFQPTFYCSNPTSECKIKSDFHDGLRVRASVQILEFNDNPEISLPRKFPGEPLARERCYDAVSDRIRNSNLLPKEKKQLLKTLKVRFEAEKKRSKTEWDPESSKQKEQLLTTLKVRFEANIKRHKDIEWKEVDKRLKNASPEKLRTLYEMERTGGEPDVVGCDENTGELIFFDCSKESPTGRRNCCYDHEGQKQAEEKGGNPAGNVVDMAKAMGLGGILNEEQDRNLRNFGTIDKNTLSWIDSPKETLERGIAKDNGGRRWNKDFYSDYEAFRGWVKL